MIRTYEDQISYFEFQVTNSRTDDELLSLKTELKEYMNSQKLEQFAWKLNEDYIELKNQIHEKLDKQYVTEEEYNL